MRTLERRDLMSTRICACCGEIFIVRPQIPNQAFCSAEICQRERRLRWQRDKMLHDPDYRENQSRNQRAWLDRHPEYWRRYRGNSAKRPHREDREPDNCGLPFSGIYQIEVQRRLDPAKSDVWIAEITRVCEDCLCKKDACKDRT